MKYSEPILLPLPRELFEKIKEDIYSTRLNRNIIKECEPIIKSIQEGKFTLQSKEFDNS